MKHFIVKDTKYITPNTLLLTLNPDSNQDKFSNKPGQYAAIGYRKSDRPSLMRCFSIVSSPTSGDEVQFAMRVYGNFTRSISKLQAGDQVFAHGPFGNFVIDEKYDQNVILMAGGIGITPFMSMIRHATETKSKLPITLLYSCNSEVNIPFFDELVALEKNNPRLKIAFIITNGSTNNLAGATVLSGAITKARLKELTNGKFNAFTHFICGPKGFTHGIEEILEHNGTKPENVVTEEFTPSSKMKAEVTPPRYRVSRWTYGLAGATLILGIFFIMSIDIVRALPKLRAASTVQTNTTKSTSPTTKSSTPTNTSSTSSGSNTSSTSTSTNSSNSSSYTAPVTSVS